jgi:DNA-binding MarR family transcriptional regulator
MRGQFTRGRIDLDKAISFAIQQAYERVRVTLYREFHDKGLAITPEQWIVLVLLWEHDGRTPSELRATTLRDRPTIRASSTRWSATASAPVSR